MDTNNIIYAWLDQNGDPYYIGKTKCLRVRNNEHRCKVNNGSNLPKYNKLRKLLRQGFQWDILVLEDEIATEGELSTRECYWIVFYRGRGCKLYNLTDGGEGGDVFSSKTDEEKCEIKRKIRETLDSKSEEEKRRTRKRQSKAQIRKNAEASPEQRKSWADSKRGRKCSPETKRKMSERARGRIFSDEHRKNLSKARQNRVTKPETREKLRAGRGKINIGKFRCISPEGQEYLTDRGLSDFCREHGLQRSNMIKVANGERPVHKGWKCERLSR